MFYFGCQQPMAREWGAGGENSDQRLTLPYIPNNREQEILQAEGGTICRDSSQLWQSARNWSLVVWPTSSWFKYSLSLVPGSVFFPFPEASFGNGGSLCHGYSLVSMKFILSLVEVSVSMRQHRGCGSEYYLWEGTKGPWLCLMTILLFTWSLLTIFLCSCISLLLWKFKFFYRQAEDFGARTIGSLYVLLLRRREEERKWWMWLNTIINILRNT